jgi:hypothetical protein
VTVNGYIPVPSFRPLVKEYLVWLVDICLFPPATPSIRRDPDPDARHSIVINIVHSTLDSRGSAVSCAAYIATETVLKLGSGCRRRLGWRCRGRRCRGGRRGLRLRCWGGRSLGHRHRAQVSADGHKLRRHPTLLAIAGHYFQPIAGLCSPNDLQPFPLFCLPDSTVIGTRPRSHIQDLGRYRGLRLRDGRRCGDRGGR